MIKVLAVVAMMAVAQLIPSCDEARDDSGQQTYEVIGRVDEKRSNPNEVIPYLIVISQLEYTVPYRFWLDVEVGDLVKRQRGQWSIIRKARG
jgi:hypothetical protein